MMYPILYLAKEQPSLSHGADGDGKPGPRWKTLAGRLFLLFAIAVVLWGAVLIYVLSTVSTPADRSSPPFANFSSITFTPATSYDQALERITDLGLQLSNTCNTGATGMPGSQSKARVWQPVGQQETFPGAHTLFIEAATYAPPDWQKRLRTDAEVIDVKQIYRLPLCSQSQLISEAPAPGTPAILTGAKPEAYAKVSFAPSTANYETALSTVSDLGLVLADPCYDRQQQDWQQHIHFPWQTKLGWHPMGQQSQFDTTRTLTLATNPMTTSTLWQSQLKALPGVTRVKTFSTATCA